MTPTLLPLGDRALLVRFSTELSDAANLLAISLARRLEANPIPGVDEVAPGLVSVLLRLQSAADYATVRSEVMLRMGDPMPTQGAVGAVHRVPINFDGEDLPSIAAQLSMAPAAFIAAHNERPLRVLATGFAPGFVYCGFHAERLVVPRRETVRPMVPAGTVLFAAGQTAIAATPIRTGWHVIGRTTFQNFDPTTDPPTKLRAGDTVSFEATA